MADGRIYFTFDTLAAGIPKADIPKAHGNQHQVLPEVELGYLRGYQKGTIKTFRRALGTLGENPGCPLADL